MNDEIKSITQWIKYFTNEFLPALTEEESEFIYTILHWDGERKAGFLLAKQIFEEGDVMDKKINKLQKDTKKLEKEEGSLLKEDKKRDKFVDAGKKALKKK